MRKKMWEQFTPTSTQIIIVIIAALKRELLPLPPPNYWTELHCWSSSFSTSAHRNRAQQVHNSQLESWGCQPYYQNLY